MSIVGAVCGERHLYCVLSEEEHSMVKKLRNALFEGLATILPLAVTIYAVWWLAAKAEGLLGPSIKTAFEKLGRNWYVPGMGVVAGLILTVIVGILARLWIARKVLDLSDRILEHIPLAKTIYGSVKDMLGLFSGEKKSFSAVVLLDMPGSSMRLLGMVTKDDFSDMPAAGDDVVGVYVPMSYQIGGFTYIVPKASVTPVDMTVEEAMRFAMTAGVSSEPPSKKLASRKPAKEGPDV